MVDELKRLQVTAGPGLVAHQGPGGLALAAIAGTGGDPLNVIIQDDEPDPGDWPVGWFWIDSDNVVGGYARKVWFKTVDSDADNDSAIVMNGWTSFTT